MEDWERIRIDKALQFLLDQRINREVSMGLPEPMIDVIDVDVGSDITNKSIVLKVSNAILLESARGGNFIVVLYVRQCRRDNLLRELLNAIQPRNYSKVFFVDELLAYPVGNHLVPRHKLCTDEMVADLLGRFSITVDALPRILLSDTIVRWYGWKVGDVIKVTRANGDDYYRLVVES